MNEYEIDELLKEFDDGKLFSFFEWSHYNCTFLALEFSISNHTDQSNTTIYQLTVEENTEDDIIANDLQISRFMIILFLMYRKIKKGHLKPVKKNLNKILRMEDKPYLDYRRTNEKKIYHYVDRGAIQMGSTCKSKICEKSSKRMCNTFSENDRINIVTCFGQI